MLNMVDNYEWRVQFVTYTVGHRKELCRAAALCGGDFADQACAETLDNLYTDQAVQQQCENQLISLQ